MFHRLFAGMLILVLLTVCVVTGLPASPKFENSQNSVDLAPSENDTVNGQVPLMNNNNASGYVSGEVIVKFRPRGAGGEGILKTIREKIHAVIGAKIKKNFANVGQSTLDLVKIPGNRSVKDAVDWYSRNPDVLYAEPNYIVYADQDPNDYYFPNLWAMNKIQAPQAWDVTTGSQDVVVAVVDTGVDATHPDLAANIWANIDEIPNDSIDNDGDGYIDDTYGWDFYNDDNSPADGHGHGTHCAGTIGAIGNNGVGVAGVAWNVKIMPLKFMDDSGSGTTADAAEAIRYAGANGADIISCSWGGGGYSQTLKDAIDGSGTVVVCAAGNSAANADSSPMYPAAYTSANIISVAATDQNDQLASFSNYGANSVDIGAPGVSILSTYPVSLGGNYATMSGTSMAAPHVSGVAALVKANSPGFTNLQVRDAVLRSADPVSGLAGNVSTGGRVNANRALSVETSQLLPDLVVSSIAGPDTAGAGQQISITEHGEEPGSREHRCHLLREVLLLE